MYKDFKVETETETFWYSYQKIDTYDALFNIIIGARGDGKTYGFKKKCILNYFRTGRQGVYLRRTEKEISKAKKNFINDIKYSFEPYRFKIFGDELQICKYDLEKDEYIGEWETVIHFCYLANSTALKSVSYDMVDIICFDEFIIQETKDNRYLYNEEQVFLDFYETVARLRDVKVYFLANAVDIVNPYFLFFNVELPVPPKTIRRCGKEVVIELADDTDYKKHKKETRFGKLIEGTEYERYAVDNEFVLNSVNLIGKKTRDCFYWLTLYVDNVPFGIYISRKTNIIYVSEDINKDVIATIETSLRHRYKSSMPSGKRRQLNIIRFRMDVGMLLFETQRAKQVVGRLLEDV